MSGASPLRHDVHVDISPVTRTEWVAQTGTVELEVELELGDVPVGRLHGRGFDHAFVGWMELMAAFEDALAALRSTERSAAVGEPGLSGATSRV
jgi:hypothetical protein